MQTPLLFMLLRLSTLIKLYARKAKLKAFPKAMKSCDTSVTPQGATFWGATVVSPKWENFMGL